MSALATTRDPREAFAQARAHAAEVEAMLGGTDMVRKPHSEGVWIRS
jgi:hypothetical protein